MNCKVKVVKIYAEDHSTVIDTHDDLDRAWLEFDTLATSSPGARDRVQLWCIASLPTLIKERIT